MENKISADELKALQAIVNAVIALDFGSSIALPWCRESFPELDNAIKHLQHITKG